MKEGAETQAMIINDIGLARLGQQGQDSYTAQGDTASIRVTRAWQSCPLALCLSFLTHSQTRIYNHSLYKVFAKLLEQRSRIST